MAKQQYCVCGHVRGVHANGAGACGTAGWDRWGEAAA